MDGLHHSRSQGSVNGIDEQRNQLKRAVNKKWI